MRLLGPTWLDRLLRLYPREYRERFGAGMREMLRQQHSDAKARGRVAALLFLVRTIRDAVLIGVTERCARFPPRSGMADQGRQRIRRGLSILPSSVVHDLRFAIRSLAGQPMFTGMTLLALIVGIGLSTSLVSALDAIFFRSWHVPNADRVVRLLSLHPRHGYGGLPIASVGHFEEHARTLGGVFAQRSHTARAGDAADGELLRVSLVSGSYFDVLEVGAALGRSFTPLEDVPGSAIAVGVISHDFLDDEVYGRSRRHRHNDSHLWSAVHRDRRCGCVFPRHQLEPPRCLGAAQ